MQPDLTHLSGEEPKISMFHEEYESHEYMLNGLKWRHYNVYWSIIYVLKNVELSTHNFVECGVADGVTSYFALNATLANIKNATSAKFYLYDAWDAMQKQHLSSTEKTLSGEYDFLEVDNTRNNLLEYEDMTIFNKGYIPEIFETVENPKKISWMHIDLNSSMPTLAALNYFYKKLDQGGIIIFDDYGWNAHLDTKLVVDNFFNAKKGILLPLPTGQAVYFSSAI